MDIYKIKNKYADELLTIPGVIGVGVDLEENVIRVEVESLSPTILSQIPENLDGYDVKVVLGRRISLL